MSAGWDLRNRARSGIMAAADQRDGARFSRVVTRREMTTCRHADCGLRKGRRAQSRSTDVRRNGPDQVDAADAVK